MDELERCITAESEKDSINPFDLLEQGIYAALETYSNVHRGSGQKSIVTTRLYEEARNIVLDFLGLNKGRYLVIFSSPRYAEILKKQLPLESNNILSSEKIGLPLGVRALAVRKNSIPCGEPFYSGGGTTKLIAADWVIWAKAPAKFEAGTPAIVNIIAFAKALLLVKKYGKGVFRDQIEVNTPVSEVLLDGYYLKYRGKELLARLRELRIGREIKVPSIKGNSRFINFDSSASTPTFEPIWNTFRHSLHIKNSSKEEIIREVKMICAEFLGSPISAYDIIFTSNTTESVNLTAENLGKASAGHAQPTIITTMLEHSSNDLPWRNVPGHTVLQADVDPNGNIDIQDLENKLITCNGIVNRKMKQVNMVAVSGASNVLGITTNIEDISRIAHKYGAAVLVDAAQMAAHKKIDMTASDIDMLAFSAHKVYAPFGCGVLVIRKGMINFNEDEYKVIKQSGEENIAGIAALGSALTLLMRIGMDTIEAEERRLTALALKGLATIDGLKVYGIHDPDSPSFGQKIGVIPFNFKSVISFTAGKFLALKSGIGVRVGCHCAHIIVKRTLNVGEGLERFQRIMQTVIPGITFPGLVRVSLGLENTDEDVHQMVTALKQISAKSNTGVKNIGKIKSQLEDFLAARTEDVYSV